MRRLPARAAHPYAHVAPRGRPRPEYRGVKFRSKSEAAVAQALDILGYQWEYEPQEFEYPLKRGTRFYSPDFRIWREGDGQAYRWLEVKGYLDGTSLTKLRRFARYFPTEATRLVLVTDSQALSLFEEKCFRDLFKTPSDVLPEIWGLRRLVQLGGKRG